MTARTPIAAGIDLGGTRCKTSLFGANWAVLETVSNATPPTYPELLDLLAQHARWVRSQAPTCPIGLCSAGRAASEGHFVASNLAAHGQAFGADVRRATGLDLPIINDGQAFTLSEATLLGQANARVFGLVIGTGLGGGYASGGPDPSAATATLGEVGHMAAPAPVIRRYGLTAPKAGQDPFDTMETLVSGPGLSALMAHFSGETHSAEDVVSKLGTPAADAAWDVFCDTLAELIVILMRTADPDVVVLGGGLGSVDRLPVDVAPKVEALQFQGFPIPKIRTASGGLESGARGAAILATQAT